MVKNKTPPPPKVVPKVQTLQSSSNGLASKAHDTRTLDKSADTEVTEQKNGMLVDTDGSLSVSTAPREPAVKSSVGESGGKKQSNKGTTPLKRKASAAVSKKRTDESTTPSETKKVPTRKKQRVTKKHAAKETKGADTTPPKAEKSPKKSPKPAKKTAHLSSLDSSPVLDHESDDDYNPFEESRSLPATKKQKRQAKANSKKRAAATKKGGGGPGTAAKTRRAARGRKNAKKVKKAADDVGDASGDKHVDACSENGEHKDGDVDMEAATAPETSLDAPQEDGENVRKSPRALRARKRARKATTSLTL